MEKRGKLIVLDGNDGSGKRTQAELLTNYLNGSVLLLSFPRYRENFFGELLWKALRGEYGDFVELDPHLASPLYAADRWESKEKILDTIEQGGFVVCDRWVSSNQIHQGGKIADVAKRTKFLDWLDRLEYKTFGLPLPDVSVFLDVPVDVSLELIKEKSKDTVEDNRRYLENSLETARWLVERDPMKSWIWIKCADSSGVMRSREEIHEEIVGTLQERGII